MRKFMLIASVLLVITAAALCQVPGSISAKTGLASFKFGGVDMTYDKVTGDFNQSYGFTTAMITFSKDGKPTGDHLTISLMMQKPGPVDLNQPMGNGIGYWKGGKIFSFIKGKSQCTMNVTKLSTASVEGTAECPVINENSGEGKSSLTSVKFSASTK